MNESQRRVVRNLSAEVKRASSLTDIDLRNLEMQMIMLNLKSTNPDIASLAALIAEIASLARK